MRRRLASLFAWIGGLTVGMLGLLVILGLASWYYQSRIPRNTVLELDLEQILRETTPLNPVEQIFGRSRPVVREVVEALDRASRDQSVVGLVAMVGAGGHGLAVTQELRDSVAAFREQGKFALAYAETFGEVGPGNGGYYLASAFGEIYLQPSGDVNLTGLMFEYPFVRGSLEKLGVTPRMDHRHEFKNAMNMYTNKAFTKSHREATESLMNSQYSQLVRGIAEGRGIEQDTLRALIDKGPFLGQEAVDRGLVDGLAYRDQVLGRVRDKAADPAAPLMRMEDYVEKAVRGLKTGPVIALIHGEGVVARGESSVDVLSGAQTMGSATVSKALRQAVDDDNVKGILLRVNSPGGSYIASDTIWRETVRAKEAGKPLIVSMGNVAASGGYFVAMDSAKIVAQPGTVTASIGVLAGKMIADGLWQKLGLSWDEAHTSENAGMWSNNRDYSDGEWQRFQAWLDRVYDDFTTKVAKGRQLAIEDVLQIAKGRVWTGEQAKQHGLVDALGGYQVSLDLMREAIGLDPNQELTLELFPRPESAWEAAFGSFGVKRLPPTTLMGVPLKELQPWLVQLRELGLGSTADHVLLMPPMYPTH